jgi:DNA invertase Pin-like site-specific DNA recombinase
MNTNENGNVRYFIYARKSTNTEGKQVTSIEDQLAVLKNYAKDRELTVVDTLIEKHSAKEGGKRPIFKQMVNRLKNQEANGILTWAPDRLSRNLRDAADIMDLIDNGYLVDLASPQMSFSNDPSGKLMLTMTFGQAKFYIDSLRENVKRGFHQKCLRGDYPSRAPFGYINDARTKTIVPVRDIAPHITEAFELYSKGDTSLSALANFLFERGVYTTCSKKRIEPIRVKHMLENPFYIGLFKYSGEIYEGNHKPIVSKATFDRVQEVLQSRNKTKVHTVKEPHPYGAGLIKCRTCGMSIYPEMHTKTMQNGTIHQYTHYRCTKKSKTIRCTEPVIRAEVLDTQISELIKSYTLPTNAAEFIRNRAAEDKVRSAEVANEFIKKADVELSEISGKLTRLLDGYVDGLIDTETYSGRKLELMTKKKSLSEQIDSHRKSGTEWYENLMEWTTRAESLEKIALLGGGLEKRTACRNLFGTELTLGSASVGLGACPNLPEASKKGKNLRAAPWAALVAAGAASDRFNKIDSCMLY